MPETPSLLLPERGRLQIGAFATDIGAPASNAVIQVTPHNDAGNVLEVLETDSSGQTPTLELPAPPAEFSREPTAFQPYSEYDLYVSMDGYQPQRILGVQLFPDTTAQQNVRLSPAAELRPDSRVIQVRTHTLWGSFPPKTPEAEVKELPPALGNVVLPNPVVPEFIVVHDGRPSDSSARNYRVPFAEYIKNVASSEIFSTWPAETIRANVLAILSFTLNRVYTEWYRSRGYDFTITSSTAFDQSFSYGRNLFAEISTVVDELFTTFITRPGIRQPLFAQYCDGKRTTCPNWLSQWGSMTMGEQGHGHLDILRRFYGQDVFLMQAPRVEGIPVSYPGAPLRVGATGAAVRTVQEQLNAVARNYPAIPRVQEDGVFGQETRAAVETFQRIFRLGVDGVVGFATWYRLSKLYTAVARLAEL